MKRALVLALAFCGACKPDAAAPEPAKTQAETRDPEDVARRDVHAAFVAARNAVHHASDGGGRAWLELAQGETGEVEASSSGRWKLVYEAGELGLAKGGALYFQVSPFFEWSTPQVEREDAPGFTRVSTDADGVELEARTLDQQLLGIEIGGRALRAGERIRIEYGAGPAGSRSDPYAETNSRLWFAVDGDGDGVRKVLADSPGVDVLPGEPALAVATLTSTARAGDTVRFTIALLDDRANAVGPCEATVELEGLGNGLELPQKIELAPSERGRRTVEGRATADGVYRLDVRVTLDGRTLETRTNPLSVGGGPRIWWGDLHGHSSYSDGSGTPQAWFDYARNVAALDLAALTDHDHWGLVFLDENPHLWAELVGAARAANEPGRFLALPGFEWTSWIYGHRHVVYFGEDAPLLSSMDERFDTPQELRDGLRALAALSIPHHPAGGPMATDWRIAPDLAVEPVVEICSAHGSSEALDSPRVLHSPRPGHFGRDALKKGYKLGFVGSGDGHDGHAGLAWKGPHYPTGGLVAVLADELTPASVLDAFRHRRVYATSGPRILLRFAVGRARMGEVLPAAEAAGDSTMFVQVVAQSPLETIEVIVGDEILSLECRNELEYSASATLSALKPGEFVYLRVLQLDGGMAWSSPVFVE